MSRSAPWRQWMRVTTAGALAVSCGFAASCKVTDD